jgi:hypothetical protein
MDRNLRPASLILSSPRHWLQGLVLAASVAGTGLAAGLVAPATAVAQAEADRSMSVPIAADAPERYTVQKGDTLWDISAMYLKDPWYWPEIWYVNPGIANPHLIYPGDVLYFSYVDGKPRVTLERSSATRLSPEVRSQPLDGAIRAIPYELLMRFVNRPQLLEKDEVRDRPYVVGIRDRHIIGSDMNEVYARGLEEPAIGSRYTIVNVGEKLIDPDDGDLLGYMGHYAGTSLVIDNTGQQKGDEALTHLSIVETGREILQGDKLLPANVDVGPDFVPSAPADEKLNGQVVAVVDGVWVAGKFQVVAINRGKKHGLVPGNAVAIFERGEDVRDRADEGALGWRKLSTNYEKVRLPKERSGTVLLFRVHDRMSYGLIVDSTHVMRVGDFVKHPSIGHRDAGTASYYAR